MIQPLRSKSSRHKVARMAVSTSAVLQAPTAGWYVGANLADAPKGTAYILDNGFPQLDYVRMRRGCTAFATGMPSAPVSTLMVWTGPTSSKMFAFDSGKIYDVSSGGAVGAAAVSGLNTSANLEYIQFTGTGGSYLICVNGWDAAQIFDGSAWGTTPAITGLVNPLAYLWVHKNRIYGVERDTLNAWYLALDAIGGAATKFPLTSIFSRGGYLLCGASWSISSNSGLYQVSVFITSEGEVAIYDGSSPADTAWALKGVYKISKPLGRRCLMPAGGDLAIMTEDGIIPLSAVMTLDQIALQNKAITQPIAPAWRKAVIDRAGINGWQIILWPLESMGVVCLPKTDSGDRTQFIANARTGAWARYIGWDANCFAVFNNKLYFGTSDGRVMQGEVGGNDDGANYTWTVFPSYSHLNARGTRKDVRLVRPRIQASFQVSVQVTTQVDYNTSKPLAPTASAVVSGAALWDVALWDVAIWPADLLDVSKWTDAPGLGEVVSPVVQLTISTTLTPDIRITATEVLYENANVLG